MLQVLPEMGKIEFMLGAGFPPGYAYFCFAEAPARYKGADLHRIHCHIRIHFDKMNLSRLAR